jgi:hypothetical protein
MQAGGARFTLNGAAGFQPADGSSRLWGEGRTAGGEPTAPWGGAALQMRLRGGGRTAGRMPTAPLEGAAFERAPLAIY